MTLEQLLARTLAGGTALACIIMTVGLVTGLETLVVAGIASLIALPALRVMILVGAFLRQRDARLAGLGLLVLAIIGAGLVIAYVR